jgi:hypothetical protein
MTEFNFSLIVGSNIHVTYTHTVTYFVLNLKLANIAANYNNPSSPKNCKEGQSQVTFMPDWNVTTRSLTTVYKLSR